MGKSTVVVTDHDFEDLSVERDVLDAVADVRALADDVGEAPPPEVAIETLRDADAVLNLRYELDGTLIDGLERCEIIARYGTGVDNVDLDAATERGIPVTNVRGYCTEEVATHAISHALALLRGLKPHDAAVADGRWDRRDGPELRRFSTLTAGVVGYGSIGRAVGERFAALGLDVLASDPYLTEADVEDGSADLVVFDELIERSDVVSIHMPLTEETRGMFDAETFVRMRNSAYLVNVARGGIVDTDHLVRALERDELAGAGLDVFPEEPPADDDLLRDHPSVLTTPHVAWYSEEANEQRRREAAENVKTVLTGGPPESVVNDVPLQ